MSIMTFVDEIRNAAAMARANTTSIETNASAISTNAAADLLQTQMITTLESTILGMIRESLFKLPINASTVGSNIDLATALVPGQTLDGQTLVAGMRVLVIDQTDKKENGVYEIRDTGGPIRAVDCDEAGEICCAFFQVVSGTANAGKLYQCTNTECVMGTSEITIVQREFATGT